MGEKIDLQEETCNLRQDTPRLLQWKLCLPQFLACCVSHSLVIHSGISLVFSAVLLPQLMDDNSQLPITSDDASWIASVVTIGTPIGAIVIGPIIDKYGRRTGCRICASLVFLSWALVALSYSVPMLCFSRLMGGVASGLSTVSLVYVSEITHPVIRPALLCLNSVFFSLGILLTCLAGSWLPWRTIAFCSVGLSTLFLGLLWTVPESPYWLAVQSKGQEDSTHWANALSSLRWLYRNELVSNYEIEALRQNLEDGNKTLSLSECIKGFRRRAVLKPFSLLILLFVFQQFSGAYVTIFYAVHLFRKVSGKISFGIDALEALIVMGAVRFIMSVLVSVLSNKLGRRPLLILSFAGMSITSLVLGIRLYSTIPRNQSNLFIENMNESSVFSVIFILLFVCFSALGVLVIPWTLAVELLPLQVRGIGGGVMVSWAYILMFITVKSFPYIFNFIGVSFVFLSLSVICFFAIIFVYIHIPETFGKTFAEIESSFQ